VLAVSASGEPSSASSNRRRAGPRATRTGQGLLGVVDGLERLGVRDHPGRVGRVRHPEGDHDVALTGSRPGCSRHERQGLGAGLRRSTARALTVTDQPMQSIAVH
jgi:hypothetical protein